MADEQNTSKKFDPLVKGGIAGSEEESKKLVDTGKKSIKTAADIIDAGPGRFIRGNASRSNKKSIIGMAAKNTFEFPVFVSKSVPLDYATATNSLLEQIYASYLQMAISLNPVIDSKTALTGGPFSKFKTNITKYVEYTDMFYAHDACYASYQDDEYMMEFNMISITDNEASIINESVDYQPLSEFEHFFQEAAKSKKSKTNKNNPDGPKYASIDDAVKDAGLNPADFRQTTSKNTGTATNDYSYTTSVQTGSPSGNSGGRSGGGSGFTQTDKNGNSISASHEESTKDESAFFQKQGALQLLKLHEEVNNAAEEFKNLVTQGKLLQKQLDDATSEEAKKELENRLSIQGKQKKELDQKIKNLKAQVQKIHLELNADEDFKKKNPQLFKSLSYGEELLNKRLKLIYDTENAGLDNAQKILDLKRDTDRWKMELERHAKDMMVRAPQFLDETKIQKLNTMKPLMMQVQLKVMDKKGGISSPMEYIVGVKTHCRLIDPETLPDVVNFPLKKMDKLTRKAKWRAGEIKFFEYLFNIKEKKQTAIDSRDPKRKWYRRLYELAHKKGDANVAARISGNNHSGLIPNATIMLAQTDVDNVKSTTNIDLLKSSTARDFCKELFLMSLIVVDLDAESIKVLLPDINNDYEIHSLASVKKQLATLDTTGDKTRDMFKLLGK